MNDFDLIPKLVLAMRLGISVQSLDSWVRDGLMPKPVKIKNRSYFRQSEVDEAIRNQQKETH